MKNALGIAIIGFGGMGSQHAAAMKPVDELKLVGTFDIKAERQQYSSSLGYHAFPDFDAVLDDKNVDIILVATPNHLHKDISIRALKAGKHVICEKPATLCSADLQVILDTAKRCRRVFVVHQNRRWDEDFCIIKQIYKDQTIGKITNIESRVHGSQGIPGDWRTKKEFGGGMLLDWGVHLIDQLLCMVDERIISVYCKLTHVGGEECDDGVRLMLTFESGMTALLEVATWNMLPLPRWYMNGMAGSVVINDFWSYQGSIAKLKADEKNNTTPVTAGKGITKTMAPRDPNTLEYLQIPHLDTDVRDFYRNVVATINGKSRLIVDPGQSMRVIRLIETAFRSDELNQVMRFE